MKVLKVLLGIIVLVAIVALAGGYYLYKNLNTIVKDVIETQGPQFLQTDVNLNQVNLDLLNGRGEIEGLVIGNPAGFQSNSSFEMGKITLEVDPEALMENPDVIFIKELTIDGALLTAEQKGKTTNLQALQKNIEDSLGAQTSSAPDDSAGAEKRFAIGTFKFINSKLNLVSEQLGDTSLSLPELSFNDIGDKNTGLTPKELISAILTPLIKEARKSATGALKDRVESEAKDQLNKALDEKLSDKDKENLDKLKDLFN